jgi:hypothetical protein
MKKSTSLIALFVATLALPLSAQAQGIVGGAAEGSRQGAEAAGPVGGLVGGVVGGVTGGIAGLLGVDQRPRFREYVVREQVPSYRYTEEVRVGTVLPQSGVVYREVPAEFGVSGYSYTIVNDRPVLVEPRTRRIVQVIE